MAILDTDIKLMASERLTDDDDGGGMMSAVEVQDGVVNNLFPDISRLNRTYGRVDLRKCYAAVLTANQDIYYGSHVIVTDTPDDPRVSVMMFTTGSYTDERAAAQNRIESYVVKGPVSDYTLLGDQLEGQRMVKVYSRVDAKLPEIGQVYMLSLEDENGESTGGFQYIRVTTIEHEILEFEDDKGIYQRRVITLGIGSKLRETFAGPQTASRYSAVETDTVFRTTQVADASKYYGQVKVSEAISNSPMSIKLDSIYGQLVPSATVESPVANVAAGVERLNIVAAGDPYSITTAKASTFSFGRAITEGSVTVNYGGSSTFEDDGNGALICTYTTSSSYGVVGAQNGSIDYESGTVTSFSVVGSYTITMTATPAAAIYDTAHTDHEKIELINRGYNYVKTLRPMPQPGTLFVDYMAQGEWYRMQDNGSGVLEDEAGGAGTIDYATGTVVATLGALPDTDSEVIYTWASPAHYEIRTTDPDIETGYLYFTVSAGEFLPNSLSFNYDAGGVVRTVTDDGSGNLIGDGTGHVIYGLGQVGLKPTYLPDSDSVLTINYDKGTIQQETLTSYGMSGDDATFTVAGKPIKPGTFAAEFSQDWSYVTDGISSDKNNTGTRTVTVSDNGDGTLSNGGTINYTTGLVSMPVNYSSSSAKQYTNTGVYVSKATSGSITGNIDIYYQLDSVIPDAVTESAAIPNVTIDLTPTTLRDIVPGSVEFIWGGKTYIDRSGEIYTDWDRQTGAANAVGVIDYSTGIISMNEYTGGGNNSLTLKTMLTKIGAWYAYSIYFRTPGAPMRPLSMYFMATKPDGSTIGMTPNGQGEIDTNDAQGRVDYETGITSIEFGRYVLETSLTADQRADFWYDAANIQEDGTIWVPDPVEPTTMKYNAVVYSMMPLDESILGLDPVRLPIDGRVPIVRSGDVGVIHNTKREELPNPISAGQTVTLARNELAACYLVDQNNTVVDTAQYSTDREAGTVTMADPMDLTGLVEPLVAVNRIEDMVLVNEAQINGQITLVGAVERDYDATDTYFSTALIFNNIASRAHHIFSQSTWTSVWQDTRIGGVTTAQYNDRLYPIQVDNKNAIRERWAIIFTGTASFNVVGEVSGQIATGITGEDCQPINPITGEPYFTILASGWGSGWSSNNVLRFNTDAAHAPIWIARTTISGKPTKEDDSFKLQIRGGCRLMTSILDAGHPAVALMLTMDDLSGGVLVDQSGNLEDGTIHGITAVAGIRNGAAYYNGSSYISFQDDTKSKLAFIHQTAVFHIATWVNFSNVNNGALNPILSSSLGSTTKGFSFFADDRSTYSYNKVLRLIITKGEHGNPVVDYKAPNNTVPDDGSYHLFEAWGDGSNIVLAVDGVTVGSSGVSSGGSGEMDNNLFLGAVAADTPSTFFAGKQDFTAIYRRPLTASERLEILELPNPYEVSGFIDVDAVPFSTPVRIYSATTGELLKETVSNVSGEYKQVLGANDPVVVVPEQPTGYEPLIHGPITPAPRS